MDQQQQFLHLLQKYRQVQLSLSPEQKTAHARQIQFLKYLDLYQDRLAQIQHSAAAVPPQIAFTYTLNLPTSPVLAQYRVRHPDLPALDVDVVTTRDYQEEFKARAAAGCTRRLAAYPAWSMVVCYPVCCLWVIPRAFKQAMDEAADKQVVEMGAVMGGPGDEGLAVTQDMLMQPKAGWNGSVAGQAWDYAMEKRRLEQVGVGSVGGSVDGGEGRSMTRDSSSSSDVFMEALTGEQSDGQSADAEKIGGLPSGSSEKIVSSGGSFEG